MSHWFQWHKRSEGLFAVACLTLRSRVEQCDWLRLRVVTISLAALVVGLSEHQVMAESPEATIKAEVYGLKDVKGTVGCFLFDQADGFPSKSKKSRAQIWAKIDKNKAVCTFEGLHPGWYAVAVMHDANSNAKMDVNFIGIPTEGYGASNDAKGTMGPPKFADAKVEVSGGVKKLRIKMNY